ncbi:PfkB family carbohydrate kinase [Capillimicrobium parvum]|uniref:Ribokinase n=1 Tax=Capillimicrobium parvum TaxID=2884022 RepID=A0A9E6XTA8_9ACTN|nr:PfkB family carbohydrate kinase [Capillimicrobium parvum]UGS34121.1 Ribokinase [Capillimicrobium parvum]
MSAPRAAVVGHVEWVDFAVVDRLPAPGEIVHAHEAFADVGGGGGIAAVAMARLAGGAQLFTALGDDAHAAASERALRAHGVTVRAGRRERGQRRCFTHLSTADRERAITVLGPRMMPSGDDPLPWEALGDLDAVFVTAGDAAAIRRARAARIVVATPRAAPDLLDAAIALDAVVFSDADAGERGIAETLDPAPALVMRTRGAAGGVWETSAGAPGAWAAAPLPGEPVDAFGCGDAFAAAVTLGLAAGVGVERAAAFGARVGAAVVCGRGPYGARLEDVARPW